MKCSCSIKAYIFQSWKSKTDFKFTLSPLSHKLCFGCLFAKRDPATLRDLHSSQGEKLEVGVKSCWWGKTVTRTWHIHQTIFDHWIKDLSFLKVHAYIYWHFVEIRLSFWFHRKRAGFVSANIKREKERTRNHYHPRCLHFYFISFLSELKWDCLVWSLKKQYT